MKTIEVEVAIMQHFDVRRNVIVPNVSWGIFRPGIGQLHEIDLLVLSGSNYATEVEIKVTKADLKRIGRKCTATLTD